MSKMTKLIHSPRAFFRDSAIVREVSQLFGATHCRLPRSRNQGEKLLNYLPSTMGADTSALATDATSCKSEETNNTNNPKGKSLRSAERWFNPAQSESLAATLEKPGPHFVFVPWIAGHGDALMKKVAAHSDANLTSLEIFRDSNNRETRMAISDFARGNPDSYRRLVLQHLIPLARKIDGVLLSFDWHPVMREIAMACRQLGVPCILIPHESVFMDENKYYCDIHTGVDVPNCDLVLGWGKLQERIFIERGFAPDRFFSVGSPKLDAVVTYRPQLDYGAFCNVMGLEQSQKTILFALQPLDSQTDNTRQARDAQERAVTDTLDFVEQAGAQLIVRCPPSKDRVLSPKLVERLRASASCAIDGLESDQGYVLSAEETLFHSAATVSVNSTMLFEAILMGRPAVSAKYLAFDQMWQRLGVPAAPDRQSLWYELESALTRGEPAISDAQLDWARAAFSAGDFDGKSVERIWSHLRAVAAQPRHRVLQSQAAWACMFDENKRFATVCIPSEDGVLNGVQANLPALLNADRLLKPKTVAEAAGADLFVQWGITPTPLKAKIDSIRRDLGRSKLIIEDGFIRSLNIGLSGEPALSIIMDDITAYYDATRPSRLQHLMNSDAALTEEQIRFSEEAIAEIVVNRVSKYNHGPILPLKIGASGRRKVLVVDQRYGDQSVTSGLADERSFMRMLVDSIQNNPDADIIIKQHPDATSGLKESYLSCQRIGFTRQMENVHVVDYDVNPYCLFDLVDDVYVVTSGMGFEALMAGKRVHCYGVPFYANRGVTHDQITVDHRTRQRSIPEIFHFAYVILSRYYNPRTGRRCTVQDLVTYIAAERDSHDRCRAGADRLHLAAASLAKDKSSHRDTAAAA